MEINDINRDELKELMREAFTDVLTKRTDLIEDAVVHAIEDIGLAMAMEEGRTGECVDTDEFIGKLDERSSPSEFLHRKDVYRYFPKRK